MKTMTVDEYRPLLIRAIKDSREKRWILLMQKGEQIKSIPPCALCVLSAKFNEDEAFSFSDVHHIVCPFYNDRNEEYCSCSDGWWAWCDADTKEENIAAAKQVLAELDAIDVEEWIETLVKRGALVP